MPSGWKCDLLFKNKIKELIDKYGDDHAKVVKEIMGMCGVSERQAQDNFRSIKTLIDIEKTAVNRVSKETLVKKLNPTILLEIAKTPEDKQQEVLEKIDKGEIKTAKEVKSYRETGNAKELQSMIEDELGVKMEDTKNIEVIITLTLSNYKKLEDYCKPIVVSKWAEDILVKEIKKVINNGKD